MTAAVSRKVPAGRLAAWAAIALFAMPASSKPDDQAIANAPGHMLYGDPSAPDISGLFLGTYVAAPGTPTQVPVKPRDRTMWWPWPPPLTPEYQKRYDELAAAAEKGRALGDSGARCRPFGLPQVMVVGVYQNEIIQTPGQVSIWAYSQLPIIIWTDGRGHPKDLAPSYNGHTIGYWDGDTLHADTVGILAGTSTGPDVPRIPHSDKLHMQWLIRKVSPDVIHMQITLFDKEALTEPMTTTEILRRRGGPNWEQLDDISCFENNRNLVDEKDEAPGFTKF